MTLGRRDLLASAGRALLASTAASGQVFAGMRNVNDLEPQYGEVAWRPDVVSPPERFVGGTIEIPDRSGFGVALNDEVISARALPL
jgi:L-alanine-DL-glutamate epimerase-like enolase superfamily enzyme